MTNPEFSDAFTVLLNSFDTPSQFGEQASRREIVLNEYEKSLFLTQSQEEIVVNLYNGKNPYGDSFESTEEIRRYLDTLVKTKVFTMSDALTDKGVSPNSVLFKLPKDAAFITMEQITYNDSRLGCYDGKTANVYPVTQDEYSRVKDNPFRGPTKYKAIRLDTGDRIIELIPKYTIGEYLIKYLSKPEPIILEDLPDGLTIEGLNKQTECKLNSILHHAILMRAVQMALQSKGISVK